MKKSFMLTLALLAYFLPAEAQLSFGIQASHINSWMGCGGVSCYGLEPVRLNGFGISVPIYYRFGKHFSLGIEPGTAQRGGYNEMGSYYDLIDFVAIDDRVSYYGSESSLQINHLALPIMAMFSVPIAGDRFGFFLKGGIGPSWMVSAYREGSGGNSFSFRETSDPRIDFSEEKDWNRLDIGMYSGAGIDFKTGTGSLRLSADSYLGLRNARSYYFSSKFRSLGVSLGYHLMFR